MDSPKRKYLTTFFSVLFAFGALSPLHGQQLAWLPADNSGLRKSAIFGYYGTSGDKTLLNSGDNKLLVFDTKAMALERTYDFEKFSEEKGENFLRMVRLEDGWAAVIARGRMFKKDEDFELKVAKMTDTGFDAPQPWIRMPREAMRDNAYSFREYQLSANGKYIMTALTNFSTGKPQRTVYDTKLKEVYVHALPEKLKHKGAEFDLVNGIRAEFVDNEGNFYLGGILEDARKERHYPFVYAYNIAENESKVHILEMDVEVSSIQNKANYVLSKKGPYTAPPGQVKFHWDNAIGRLTMAGLFSDELGGGMVIFQYDAKAETVTPLRKHAFPPALTKQLSEESYDGKAVEGTTYFTDLVVKENKDILCLLEIDNSELPVMMGNPQGRGGHTEFKDIVFLNFGKDGDLTFFGNIPKSQKFVQSDEELSFVPVCMGNTVQVVFTEGNKKERKMELMTCAIDEMGKLNKKALGAIPEQTTLWFDRKRYGLAAAYEKNYSMEGWPGKSMQVSPSSLVIMGQKNEKPILLKLTF